MIRRSLFFFCREIKGTPDRRLLSRLSLFLEIWKFRKFPVLFVISTRYESAPLPLVVKSCNMAASLSSRHYNKCKMICEPVLDQK